MRSKKKVFDSVAMMREIRDQLSKKYNEDPTFSAVTLREIKKKYSSRILSVKKKNSDPAIKV